ncbi:hypothetical protein ACS0TY_024558 [Phlomoides rotata]
MSENDTSANSRNKGDSAVSANDKDNLQNAVNEWRTVVQRRDCAIDEGSEDSEWDDPVASELEMLLSHNIITTFIAAMKKITECGHTEQVAEWAILNSSFLHCSKKDAVSNVVDPALAFLKRQKELNTPKHSVFDGLEKLVDYTLLEMIFVLREVRPEFTVAEAMWALLINDLNLMSACSMDMVGSSSREASGESRSLPQTAIAPAAKAPVPSPGNQQSTCKPDDGESAKGNSSSVHEKSEP